MVNASPSTHTAPTPLLFSRSSVEGPSCYVSWPMLDWAYRLDQGLNGATSITSLSTWDMLAASLGNTKQVPFTQAPRQKLNHYPTPTLGLQSQALNISPETQQPVRFLFASFSSRLPQKLLAFPVSAAFRQQWQSKSITNTSRGGSGLSGPGLIGFSVSGLMGGGPGNLE